MPIRRMLVKRMPMRHAHDIQAYKVHPREMHVHETHAHEMHAHKRHTYKICANEMRDAENFSVVPKLPYVPVMLCLSQSHRRPETDPPT